MRPLPLPGPAEAAGPLDLRSWPSSWRRRVGLWCEGSTGGRWCSGPRRWGRCWVRPAVHSDPPWPNNARVLGCMFGMGTRLTYAVVEGGALLVVVCGTPVLVHPALLGTRTLIWHLLWLFGSQGPVLSGRGLWLIFPISHAPPPAALHQPGPLDLRSCQRRVAAVRSSAAWPLDLRSWPSSARQR